MEEILLQLLTSILIEERLQRVIADKISTPIGAYHVQTGPLFDGKWVTVIGVDHKNGKHYGPVGVERYETEDTAKSGHDTWRRLVMDTAPLVLKETATGAIISIGS